MNAYTNTNSGDFEIWWTHASAGQSALLAGGDDPSVLMHLIRAAPKRPTVLADSSLAGKFAAQMSADAMPKAEIRMSRGLIRDLSPGADRGRAAATLIIPTALLANDTEAEVRHLGDQLQLLAGYDTPPSLVRDLAISRFATSMRAYMSRGEPLLVVHDGKTLLQSHQRAFTAVFPFKQPGKPAAPRDDSKSNGTFAHVDLARPAPEQVLKYSEFLVKTEPAVLRDMHQFMMGPAAEAVFQNWRSHLQDAANVPGYELYIEIAIERLNAVAKDVA
jgi:hypothetical protein